MSIVQRVAAILLSMTFCLGAVPALANEHGGGGGGPEPLVFLVNLGSSNYLKMGLILETATPEAAHELTVYRPRILHEIILLLSEKELAKLRTLDGKKELIEEVIDTVNHVIHEKPKTGVTEALFTEFIIQ